MDKQRNFLGEFETYKGGEVNLFLKPPRNGNVGRWVLTRVTQPYIRYDFYRAMLRIQLDEYGMAINQLAHAQSFPNDSPLISDLVSVPSQTFPWQTHTLTLFEHQKPAIKTTQDGASEREAYVIKAEVEYGLLIESPSLPQARIKNMIERRADPSEVKELVSLARADAFVDSFLPKRLT